MKIKSLLLGSAAALVAVSGARAADAVVIPEPEAVEYVRVCDAAGAGYFYIPGSETCLKISGYVRYQISGQHSDWNNLTNPSVRGPLTVINTPVVTDGQIANLDLYDNAAGTKTGISGAFDSDGWNKDTEARVLFQSWTDSEYGAVTANIRFDANAINENAPTNLTMDRLYLTIGGLNMGLDTNLYDFDQDGAADALVANGVDRNQISYSADFGAVNVAIQLLEDNNANYVPNIIGKVGFALGDIGVTAAVGYDDVDAIGNSSWGAKVAATWGGLGAHVAYTSATEGAILGGGDYSSQYTWVLGANYGFDATDKLNLNVAVSYGIDHAGGTLLDNNDNDFVIGAEAKYALTDTFEVSARVRYLEDVNTTPIDAEEEAGFDWRMRFTSSF